LKGERNVREGSDWHQRDAARMGLNNITDYLNGVALF
jgi:hypothetical protein